MGPITRLTILAIMGAATTPAVAISPLMQIEQVYSNGSGTVQFIEIVDGGISDCDSAEQVFQGVRLVSTGGEAQRTFVFPNDLPTCRTSGRSILVATEGFAALGLVTPDFVIPNDFIQRPVGSIALGTNAFLSYDNLPTDGVQAIDSSGRRMQNAARNLAGATASVTPVFVDPDQHGLSGAWFEPASAGQGFTLEMYASGSAPSGLAFLTWFTYDTVAGGADRQRWYSASGPLIRGQRAVQLTIYRNTGGNFDAPPVTTAQAVGIATLGFDHCSSGHLSYRFDEGSGRSGSIPLTRLTRNVACTASGTSSNDADFAMSGNWFSPETSGQGFSVEANPESGVFFVAWYTYVPNGQASGAQGQRWFTAQASFTRGARSIPVTIFETTGGRFDTPTPAGQVTTAVGSGTWTFQSCNASRFEYAFSGGSSAGRTGTIPLVRVGPAPAGCVF